MNTFMYFEQIINVELGRHFSAGDALNEEFIDAVLHGDKRNRRALKTEFILFTDDFRSDHETQTAVKTHQGKLVALMDKVFSYIPDEHRADMELPEQKDSIYLLKYLYRVLLSGLNYIEHKFGRYIDKDISIPIGEVLTLSKRAREQLPLITDSPRMHALDVYLREIVTRPLTQLAEGDAADEPVTWRKKAYLKRLTAQLKAFNVAEEAGEGRSLTMELHALLQRINFNHPAYVSYMISLLDDEISEQKNNRDKCTTIIMQQRKINKCIAERTIAYDMCQMPLKEQLMEWLGYELDCFESLIRLDAMRSAYSCMN
ncbi:hypothetical protein [Chitinophaga agri]|uniref:Uncharacterized protein n=1 Tax=Chitinophaga agri TaxID=2703787 RepID=A0A6B9ZMW9_9BACT|nr:hypothetical protein [Chitinophaga agri]QHS62981.1 hypothetical protein GWR21_26360 [Chitinophaga agri]